MNISREKDVGSSVCRVAGKDPFVYFHVTQYLIYNILYDAAGWRRQARETVVCIACFVCAFSFVACMSSCASRTRLAHANVQCVSIAPHIFIYAIRFSIFYRLFISVPRARRICASEALFLKKGKGKHRAEGRGTSSERQPLASKFHRPRATIVIHYLATLHASRVEINGVTFCNYTPFGSMPTSRSNRSDVPATRLKIYDFKVSATLLIIQHGWRFFSIFRFFASKLILPVLRWAWYSWEWYYCVYYKKFYSTIFWNIF